MKKMLFTALVAACAMTACGTKTTETAAAAEEVTREIGSSDIAYVQVEAVLAQCDLFLNEGKALQEKTQKAQKSWAQKEQNLQSEAAQLQEKYQKGLITTNDAQAQQQSTKSAWRHTSPRRRKRHRRSMKRTMSSPTGRRICCTAPCRISTPTKSTR